MLRRLGLSCYISRCTDPYTNLAFEDWLLKNSDEDSHVLYLWRNRPTINPWKECNLDMMGEKDVWLARRTSGGGTVYHDLGNTNYTVLMPRRSFARDTCAEMVARALQHEDIAAYVNERHDVTVDGLKISGSAYRLTSRRAFHHGTMLIDADLTRLHGCLDSKSRNIRAKGVDSVRSKVANLRDYSWTIDHSSFCNAVVGEFQRTFGRLEEKDMEVWSEGDQGILDKVGKERERITQWQWLFGQTPEFAHSISGEFVWGRVARKNDGGKWRWSRTRRFSYTSCGYRFCGQTTRRPSES
ncbi:lipoate-protein ligase [Linderina pennispora]|uniref:Putative lipoate-protein ligase A n=1 Tax=Linderina pennispora TaxID=61395 RepID=A0A1Y1W039_9FUNG|nr:lipoate-protein ligase [Linderina pennispora]ORX66888.1 lipoate-protein ligase [Linderina pennispora]